jgi:hypothetical protein
MPVLLASTVLLAGELGDRILHQGAVLPQFKMDVVVLAIFSVLVAYTPLTFFITHLYEARWKGRRDYGDFGSRYVTDFREKWIKGRSESGAELGSGDIQSLADLANSFEVVQQMSLVPFAFKSVMWLGILVLLPLTPLLFTMIPVDEMIDRLVKLVL